MCTVKDHLPEEAGDVGPCDCAVSVWVSCLTFLYYLDAPAGFGVIPDDAAVFPGFPFRVGAILGRSASSAARSATTCSLSPRCWKTSTMNTMSFPETFDAKTGAQGVTTERGLRYERKWLFKEIMARFPRVEKKEDPERENAWKQE